MLAQRLVRRICEHCKRPATITRELLVESALDPTLADDAGRSTRATGCIECGGTGFKGRTAICELLDLSDRIRDMILERRPTSEIKRAAREEGMTFLRECAVGRGARRRDDAARDQQGDVRRVRTECCASLLARSGAADRSRSRSRSRRVTVVELGRSAARPSVVGYATEPLPDGRSRRR